MASYCYLYTHHAWCVYVNERIIAKCRTQQEAHQVAEDYNELHR